MDKRRSDGLKTLLTDIRKMKRANRLRLETDPEKVGEILEKILKETIVLSSSGENVISRSALKELHQVRKGLVAQQIDAGSKTANYVAAFSGVLDQLDTSSRKTDSISEPVKKTASAFMENLPSSDTVISAIMTANPLLGYTMKMGSDLMNTFKQNSQIKEQNERELMAQRKSALEEQLSFLETEKKVADEKDSGNDDKNINDIYSRVIQEIRDEIKKITKALGKDSNNVENTNNILEKIHDVESARWESEKSQESIDGLLEREKVTETGSAVGASGLFFEQASNDEEYSGLFDKIKGGFGGILSGLMTPFTGLIGFLKTAGGLLLKFGKFTGVVAAVKAVYDFVDGIFNASKILGTDDIDWVDRINVGISNVLSGLMEPINWLSEKLFDYSLYEGSREDLTRKIFGFFDNFVENMSNIFDMIIESGRNFIDTFSFDFIAPKFEEIVQPVTNLLDNVQEVFNKTLDSVLPDWASNLLGSSSTDSVSGEVNNVSESKIQFESGERNSRENITNMMERQSSETIKNSSRVESGGTVYAPSTMNNNSSAYNYFGSDSSENREPTHRRLREKITANGF